MSDRRFNHNNSLIGCTMVKGARSASLAIAALLGLVACQGVIGEAPLGFGSPGTGDPAGTGDPGSGGSAGSNGSTGSGASAGSGGTSDPTGGAGGTGGSGSAGGTGGGNGNTATLPARIRRLTNAEYDASVNKLLDANSTFGASFTPDARQDGFTRNDAQRLDPVLTMQLDDAATQLATQARSKLATLAPCANPTSGGEACARTFLGTFVTRAYRRPVAPREIDTLLAVYRAGAEGAAYADGIEAAIHAVLVAPGFLYTTEIGTASTPASAPMTITPYETASALSYLLTGSPPDDALLADAASGALMSSDSRQAHARRLFVSPAASAQITRIVEEWLGIDRITETAKDSNAYPKFAGLKDAMKREADAFVSEVMWKTSRDIGELLSADWTIAEPNLAAMYGGTASGARVSLAGVPRRGVLNQGAFLAVHGHASESSPVLRGVAMLRRIACIDMASPTSLNIQVVPPVPDPTKTTRERFKVHTADQRCAGCHNKIDNFGFAFENFDGMGELRKEEGKPPNPVNPVDSKVTVTVGMDFDGDYPDSSALVVKMATSPKVRACFARHLFHASAAASNGSTQPAEESFLIAWSALPAEKQSNILEVLATWIGSDTFVQRRAEP
jgi:hypothetical protein